MKKELIYFLIPTIALACIAFGAHMLYRGAQINVDTDHRAIERTDKLISAIENGEREVTQAAVINMLTKFKAIKQLDVDAWQSYVEAMKSLRLASIIIIILLLSLFLKQLSLLRKKQINS